MGVGAGPVSANSPGIKLLGGAAAGGAAAGMPMKAAKGSSCAAAGGGGGRDTEEGAGNGFATRSAPSRSLSGVEAAGDPRYGGTVFGDDFGGSGVAGASPPSLFRPVKTVLHLVQRTLTPFSVTLSSPILNRVWQLAHLTIMDGLQSIAAGAPSVQANAR